MMKFIFLIIGMFLLSCQKETNPISSDNVNEKFPMKIGLNWEYTVTDSTYFYNFADSIVVKNGIMKIGIINSTLLDDGRKALSWQYWFNNKIVDTSYVIFSDDTLYFYKDKKCETINAMFLFPLQINKEWELDSCNKYRVIKQDTSHFSFGTINDIFIVEHEFICESEAGLTETYYLNSSIGIVKYTFNYQNIHYGIKQRKTWNLESFNFSQ